MARWSARSTAPRTWSATRSCASATSATMRAASGRSLKWWTEGGRAGPRVRRRAPAAAPRPGPVGARSRCPDRPVRGANRGPATATLVAAWPPGTFRPAAACGKRSAFPRYFAATQSQGVPAPMKDAFSYEQLIASGEGSLCGPGSGRLPLPPMLMFDRITHIDDEGGPHGLGRIEAELDIRPDLWFFQCHFSGDPVMPGCLGLDAMWQLIGFFLTWQKLPGRGRA